MKSRAEVSKILKDYRSSGQTQRAFAKARRLSVSTLQFWLRRERESATDQVPHASPSSRSLVPVRVVPTSANESTLRVELKNGRRVEVPSDFPTNVLPGLVSALEVNAC